MTDKDSASFLNRQNGETELQHHKRLIMGKLADKTLADYDYSELSPYVFGKEYSTDVARRMMYGSRYTLDLLDSTSIAQAPNDLKDEIESKRVELQKERQRFFDQRRLYNQAVNTSGRVDHLCEALLSAAERLPETIGNVFVDADRPQFPLEPAVNDDDSEAVLVFSDWHYGLKTSNVFNTFNTEICKKRINTVVESARDRIVRHGCRRLKIIVLGDLIHGGIHVSARVASDELVCDQLMQASEILAQAIIYLSNYVEETEVHITYGNHARAIQNKADNIHRDNFERLIPWWLESRLLAEERNLGRLLNINVVSDAGNEFILCDSCGYTFCAAHGDLDSVKEAPKLLFTLFQRKTGRSVDYILLGDKHHRESYNEMGINSILCGSLCGTDDYANDKRLYASPSQLLLIVNKKDGVDAEYHIKCE